MEKNKMIDINTVNLRNLYPTATGKTIGQTGTSSDQRRIIMNNDQKSMPLNADDSVVLNAAFIGGQANPIIAGLVFLALLLGLMFFAKRVGTDDDFKSIKPSVYNVMTISLAALIGLPVLKYLFTKFPIPALSTWALAA